METENGPAFPVVACNIINDEEFNFNNYYRKSTVIVKNNVKIGIIGFITPRTKSISNTGKLIVALYRLIMFVENYLQNCVIFTQSHKNLLDYSRRNIEIVFTFSMNRNTQVTFVDGQEIIILK